MINKPDSTPTTHSDTTPTSPIKPSQGTWGGLVMVPLTDDVLDELFPDVEQERTGSQDLQSTHSRRESRYDSSGLRSDSNFPRDSHRWQHSTRSSSVTSVDFDRVSLCDSLNLAIEDAETSALTAAELVAEKEREHQAHVIDNHFPGPDALPTVPDMCRNADAGRRVNKDDEQGRPRKNTQWNWKWWKRATK